MTPAGAPASIGGMAVAPHDDLLAGLNPAQREAVLHVDGPLLVVAGAGSGKTRVLTHRVAHLIRAHGAKPNEILAITFTNKAAGEMRERLERMLGRQARAAWILTFHAACGRMLRREAERLGYTSSFTIYDQADQVRVVRACLEDLGVDPKRFTPRGIHSQISNAKNQLIGPDEYMSRVASFYDKTVAEVYERYQRRLHSSNAVDFDDMLMLTVEAFERFRRHSPTGSTPSATSSSTSTRTRITPSTGCCSFSLPSTGTCSRWATRIRACMASEAPTSTTSSISSATSRAPARAAADRRYSADHVLDAGELDDQVQPLGPSVLVVGRRLQAARRRSCA